MKRSWILSAAAGALAMAGAARAEQWSFDVAPGDVLVVELETEATS